MPDHATASTRRPPARPPTLSLAERDRRWERARALMRQHGVQALVVGGFRAREMYESYLSDDYNEGCVFFPLEGEPVVLTWTVLRVMRARWSAERGHALWIADHRVAESGAGLAELLHERGLADAAVGIVGLRSQAPTEMYGSVPAGFWLDLTAAAPQVCWTDLSDEFSHLMLVKSDEELAQMRYAAAAAEAACAIVAEVARVGVGEEIVIAEATAEMLRHGIGLRYPAIVMNSGAQTLSWGPARWTTRGEPPRTLARGDLLQTELMPMCGNQEAQVQMTVAIGPMSELHQRCEAVARASYEAGLEALKPGTTMAELVAAMEQPLKREGCWGYTPLVHSLAPHFLMGRTTVNMEQANLAVTMAGPRAARARPRVLEAGMVLAFEPNACLGHHRVNLGGTVIVTERGNEPLNRIPTRVTRN